MSLKQHSLNFDTAVNLSCKWMSHHQPNSKTRNNKRFLWNPQDIVYNSPTSLFQGTLWVSGAGLYGSYQIREVAQDRHPASRRHPISLVLLATSPCSATLISLTPSLLPGSQLLSSSHMLVFSAGQEDFPTLAPCSGSEMICKSLHRDSLCSCFSGRLSNGKSGTL